eukprot:GFYU01008437.1.p1 GENE.GFYU01008437.1~~GFYU01008437.1.p1  ORF type:complete len:283 (-),score=93.82 GFYU01008437.1:356-1204(-)
MSRPELTAPPEIFYNADEAKKYTQNTRMIAIQNTMTERALELLALPEGQHCFLLDVGCGSGLSGEALTEAGHSWVGFDISQDMLDVAVDREIEGDVVLRDMGQGVPFRDNMFDGAVGISALQWLCNQDKRDHNPKRRMLVFFQSLYRCLCRGARAVFQVYPDTPKQMEMLTEAAMKAGFSGGLVVDYPNSTKAKKYFLTLFTGGIEQLPRAKTGEGSGDEGVGHTPHEIRREQARRRRKGRREGPYKKSKEWIANKKDRQRKQGKDVKSDSKFSGRQRKPKF